VATLDLSSAQAKIASLYVSLFGRAPDAAGLQFWSNAAATQSLAQIATALLSSQEGASAARTDAASFVTALYTATLGRAPSAT